MLGLGLQAGEKCNMPVRMWTNKETQFFIRNMRKEGFEVKKLQEGLYKCIDKGNVVFTAIKMGRFYTINLSKYYFKDDWNEDEQRSGQSV